ncbi:type II secretion system F family protein [Brevibacillus humidisoli]|uniref:type II secretion system F family protein n=1 Tax=Brevibacillus humidisoli TaxID=2895522 RepID=UPI001E37DE6F|nr:type II secretion system F family protein [Brevibacillus humidisoli]UFJ40798.1 type II secretion system F family protein [Brevibacillus humidisoli]
MSDKVWFCLLVSFLSWSLSMVCWWRYHLQRIKLLRELALLTAEKKQKVKWTVRLKHQLFRLADKLSPVGQRFPYLINQTELTRIIALAGHPHGLTVASFLGLRFVTVLLALLIGNLLSMIGFGSLTQIILLLCGFFGPALWLHAAAKKRQAQMAADLPDFLDAMSVTMQAGIPLESALKQVVGNMAGPLSEELTRFQQELDLGVPRDQAYTRLINRNRSPELETLVVALMQGSRLGVPISHTFQMMAEDMRSRQIVMIKEKASKVGPKVTLVTSFLILPGVILSVIGLLVLHFVHQSGILNMLQSS